MIRQTEEYWVLHDFSVTGCTSGKPGGVDGKCRQPEPMVLNRYPCRNKKGFTAHPARERAGAEYNEESHDRRKSGTRE